MTWLRPRPRPRITDSRVSCGVIFMSLSPLSVAVAALYCQKTKSKLHFRANWVLCNLIYGLQTQLRHLKGPGQYGRYWLAQKTKEAGYAINREAAYLHTVAFNTMPQGKRNKTVARAFVRDEAQGLTHAKVRCRSPLPSPVPWSLTLVPSSTDCQPFSKVCQPYLSDHVPTGLW